MCGAREGSSRRPEEGGRVGDSRFKKVVAAIGLDFGVLSLLGCLCNRVFVRELCFFFAFQTCFYARFYWIHRVVVTL